MVKAATDILEDVGKYVVFTDLLEQVGPMVKFQTLDEGVGGVVDGRGRGGGAPRAELLEKKILVKITARDCRMGC